MSYPSNFINGVAPGVQPMNNVTAYLELNDQTRSSETFGPYPTDAVDGAGVIANPTDVLGDLTTALSAMNTAIGVYTTNIGVLNGESDPQKSYDKAFLAQMYASKLYLLRDTMLRMAWHLKRVNGEIADVTTNHAPAAGRYPSDRHEGWTV